LQNLPHVDMMKPITKFASQVQTTERIPDMISMAFRECYHGAPGPAFLEIPRDVLDAKVDLSKVRFPQPGHYRASTRSLGNPEDIQKLADILVKSERPCVLLGTQVATCRAYDAAKEFVRKLNIPAYMNGSGRGTLPPGDPHHLHRTRSYAFEKADVIVIVGTPFDFRMGYGKRLRAETVVQIDLDYRTVGKNRDVTLGLVGDVGVILSAVTAAATGRTDNGAKKRQAWIEELHAQEKKALEKLMPDFKSDATPINPYRVAWELNEFLTEDTIYIGDGGDVVTITAQAVQPRSPGHWMDPGPLGTLGVGVPFALAAKFAHPNKEVLCYFGDGAFSLTGFDFETAVRFKLPFLGVVGNNSCMNQIRCGQIMKYGKERGDIGNMLGDVPYGKFAEILGGYGEEVRDPKQIRPALERAREAVKGGKPALVNIWVDIDVWAPGTRNQTMYK
jgi:acetolactate synthase-1/2/3 large subunit